MRRPAPRRAPFRRTGPRLIISCEGATEAAYFHRVRQQLRLPQPRVLILNEPATDPTSLVEHAIRRQLHEERMRAWDPAADTVWVVMDGEEHRTRDADNWNTARQRAMAAGVGLCVSNPCFELWYLLHVQDQSAHLTGKQTRTRLRQTFPDYEKGSCPLADPLSPDLEAALQREALLRSAAKRDGLDSLAVTPITHLAELIAALRGLADP